MDRLALPQLACPLPRVMRESSVEDSSRKAAQGEGGRRGGGSHSFPESHTHATRIVGRNTC